MEDNATTNLQRDVGKLEGKVELIEQDIIKIHNIVEMLRSKLNDIDRKQTFYSLMLVGTILLGNAIDLKVILRALF